MKIVGLFHQLLKILLLQALYASNIGPTASSANIASSTTIVETIPFEQQNLRGSILTKPQNQTISKHAAVLYCRIVLVHTMMYSGFDRTNSACIPIVEWIESDDDLFPIHVPPSILAKYNDEIHNGTLYISITNSTFSPMHGIQTNQHSSYIVLENDKLKNLQQLPRRLQQTSSTSSTAQSSKVEYKSSMSIAVVRISTIDSSPKHSVETIMRTYFGSNKNNDTTSFVKQYKQCSFGKLQWKLAPTGIIDLKLNATISLYRNNPTALVTAAQTALKVKMNIPSVSKLADKVIMCLPPGTGDWAASASINHWRVQMNHDWCLSLTGLMHELGHSIGLKHASANGIQYADQTGVMGSGYKDARGPLKCFNAYQSYQLGWYTSRHLNLLHNSDVQNGQLVHLATFVDYDITNEHQPVIVNIANTYFLLYNRKKDFNIGTEEEKANQVVITTPTIDGTNTIASLKPSDRFVIENYVVLKHDSMGNSDEYDTTSGSGNLIIDVCSEKIEQKTVKRVADVMLISIAIDKSLCITNKHSNNNKNQNNQLPSDTTNNISKTKRRIIKFAVSLFSWLNKYYLQFGIENNVKR